MTNTPCYVLKYEVSFRYFLRRENAMFAFLIGLQQFIHFLGMLVQYFSFIQTTQAKIWEHPRLF